MELADNSISLLPYDHRDSAEVFPACGLGEIQKAFREFFDRPWAALTYNGRGAIDAVMRSLPLVRDDEVFITTTFDYPNVSSCVTSTIFNYCKPARVLSDRSKAILVIHEFGVPHRNTPQLRELADQRGIPLIEDCAHTINSHRDDWQVGFFGDFVVVSFSKIFPVPLGGMLLGKEIPCVLTDLQEQAVTKVLPASTHTLEN
ncbi:MAG: DegT/DnrJ/EryC1/StrS family aminotransferase, partial [Candidatus Omnitrophica bacterium]|nr:DegT/DnrJ/EryC1/StrS family aminotransferase [Candidatus Omnitrophota bacterium]